MKITHEDLRGAYKSSIKRHIPTSREGCPNTETIFALLDKSGSSKDKNRVIDHIAGCFYCLQEFELFLDFVQDEKKAIEEIASYFRTSSGNAGTKDRRHKVAEVLSGLKVQARPPWKWAALSLAAVMLAGLFLITIRFFSTIQDDKERGKPPGEVRLISPVRGKKADIPMVFRWEKMSTAKSYQLEIFDKSLLSLWKSPRVEKDHYQLAPSEADFMVQNEVYYWAITAWLVDGTRRESRLEEFTLKE